ncbi:hypothetical protein EZS27_027000 [termite gut metagenome]|uniref:Tc1-like transposase DDE domain-containing protein n=1 Tax=termite gut metagenome TaxID=433724 RepID=A0A5J4QPZ2_9ZZZZ
MHRWSIKKFKELVAAKSTEFSNKEDSRAIKLFFQDEARFGRIDNCENIVPLFQPAYSPEVNPIESLWHPIREKGKFKNTTFYSLGEVENWLVQVIINTLDRNTLKSITLFNWIKTAI